MALGCVDRALRECDQFAEIEHPAFLRGGHIGRERRAETER
jgi:hypothetical protein